MGKKDKAAADKACDAASRYRFSEQFYTISDSYQGPNYPYTAPSGFIDAGPALAKTHVQSGVQVTSCVQLSPLVRACRWKRGRRT